MKFLKDIQEVGMFGVASKLENTIRSQKEYQNLRRSLRENGLTDFQIDMLNSSVVKRKPTGGGHSSSDYCLDDSFLRQDNYDYETMAVKNLKDKGYIEAGRDGERWWLTRLGLEAHNNLAYYNSTSEIVPVASNKKTNAVAHPKTVESQMDISLSRDGLMTTCSKIAWVLTNREAIKAHKMEQFLKEFSEGQAKIDKALHGIATAEQRVARQLLEQGPPVVDNSYWTEEDQRAQNDIYWMSGGLAFWLNPMGALADPTPAPDWWSPPVNYQSLAQKHIAARLANDVVARSLLAPPDPARPNWLCQNKVSSVVYGMDNQDDVDRFMNARRDLGEGFIVCRTDGPDYDELFEIYKSQGSVVPALPEDIEAKRETYLDDLLAELECDDDFDDFETWNAKHEVAKPKHSEKIRTGSSRKGGIVTASYGNLFIVEFDGVVRGFNNRLEAETYIGEQRTFLAQRIEAQKAAEEKRIRQKKLQMNSYKETSYNSKSYSSMNKEIYNHPYYGSSSKELN